MSNTLKAFALIPHWPVLSDRRSKRMNWSCSWAQIILDWLDPFTLYFQSDRGPVERESRAFCLCPFTKHTMDQNQHDRSANNKRYQHKDILTTLDGVHTPKKGPNRESKRRWDQQSTRTSRRRGNPISRPGSSIPETITTCKADDALNNSSSPKTFRRKKAISQSPARSKRRNTNVPPMIHKTQPIKRKHPGRAKDRDFLDEAQANQGNIASMQTERQRKRNKAKRSKEKGDTPVDDIEISPGSTESTPPSESDFDVQRILCDP